MAKRAKTKSVTKKKSKTKAATKTRPSAKKNRQAKKATQTKKNTRTKKTSQEKAIHVLTDGTGGLPRHFLTSVLSQFPTIKQAPEYHVFCSTPEFIANVFKKHIRRNSIVVHSFAERETKDTVAALAAKKGVPCFDLTGAAVAFLAEHSDCEFVEDLDRVHSQDANYFDRIDAWEYTMQHDDSRRLDTINTADLILLGLSRVSKTPTSAYLGWLGYRVANVSFTPEIGLPKEIKKNRKKVVALTIKPKQLSEIRSRRMQVNGFADVIAYAPKTEIKYAGLQHTIREVMNAETMYRDLRLPIVDVTDSTVEETAARILQIVQKST